MEQTKKCSVKSLKKNDKIRVLKCTFEPGVGHEITLLIAPHFCQSHKRQSLSEWRTKTAFAKWTSVSGASYWSDGVEWHTALNIGDSTAVVLIVEPKGKEIALYRNFALLIGSRFFSLIGESLISSTTTVH